MKGINNLIQNVLKGSTKQKIIFFSSVIGVLIAIIVIISIVAKILGARISYENLEKKLATATEKYMNANPTSLPTESNPVVVINDTTLIEGKYLKKLKSYVKDSSCNANVNVYYEEGKYVYQPFLTCDTFKTEKLTDVLKNNNTISSFGEGLYEMNNEFVYRGENPNNYLKFADEIWRIVKMNSQGQFIIIKNELNSKDYGNWDNRYNTEIGKQKGVNNFSLSRVLSTIRGYYQERYSSYDKYFSKFDLCSAKRSETEINKDGLVECSDTLTDQYIGLLPVYDYMNASLDNLCLNTSSKECQNYNYLVNSKDKWWTVTGDTKNTYNVYYIKYSGEIISEEADINANYRYVLALDKNILYKKGTGTLEDPYEIR